MCLRKAVQRYHFLFVPATKEPKKTQKRILFLGRNKYFIYFCGCKQ